VIEKRIYEKSESRQAARGRGGWQPQARMAQTGYVQHEKVVIRCAQQGAVRIGTTGRRVNVMLNVL